MGCGGFAGMVVVGVGLPAWVGGGPILAVVGRRRGCGDLDFCCDLDPVGGLRFVVGHRHGMW
uniref:Uncharacterized protein n=1 Tax=Fagus sylvatica TaxID=28930 RepID=A0A2N9EML7_FAGSY